MKKLFKLLLVLLVLNSCKKDKTAQVVSSTKETYTYSEYISIYPKSLISVAPNLKFYLNKPVEITDYAEELISISPKVKVKTRLEDDVVYLIFEEKLKANEDYKLTLHLSKLYKDIEEDLKDFPLNVKTKELMYSISLKSPKMHSKDWNYVEGFINASDIFEAEKLSEILKAEYNDKKINVKFDTSEELVSGVNFTIDSLERYENDKQLKVSWDGKSVGSVTHGDRTLTITGKSNFKVLNVEVDNEGDRKIEVTFSDPIQQNQDLKGLIQFNNFSKKAFTYKINKNVVTLYPKNFSQENLDVQIFKGIKNEDGYTLKQDLKRTVHFEQLKPEVNFINSGTILPDSKNLKINFNAVNLRAVDVTVHKIFKNNVLQFLQQNNIGNLGNLSYVGLPEAKYTIDLSNQGLQLDKVNAFAFDLATIIDVDPGAMYRVILDFSKPYSYYSCGNERETSEIKYGNKDVGTSTSRNYSYHNYTWRDKEKPCTDSYYYDKAVSTNILASNLGAIVKKGNNKNTFIAVTDILTTAPVEGAKVDFYNFQQQLVASTTTNAEGIVNYQDDKNTFFTVITKGDDVTYLKLLDGNALSMSKFDVSGVRLQKGIKGYVYGERGVWRPGDQMFLTFVMNDKANPLPEKHPIKFELFNPQGKVIEQTIQYKNANNVYAYAPKTDQDALTGNWNLKITVGDVSFSKALKVETIKPNRLKIKIATDEKLVKANTPIKGDVEVKWLHGAIAKNLSLDINGKFRQTKTSFDKFSHYNFDDITRSIETKDYNVLDGKLDEEGKTSFSLRPNFKNKAPGMLQASFITKVYENGGDFSTDVYSTKVSPYTTYVGLQNPEEKDASHYLFTDADYTFNIATVNEDGAGVASDVQVLIYKMNWSWWWNRSNDGLSYYNGSNYRQSYKSLRAKTGTNGKGTFSFKVDKNDWGRYLVKVIDKKSKHTTANIVYYDWPYWYGRKKGAKDKSNATMLVFTADKEKYEVNENAKVKFPSSAGGRALLTIENGTEVLDHYWVPTQDKETVFDFPILDTYAPNVFVNISLLQQHSQTKNDLPIRMYGSIPISVNDPATKLEPQIQMADEIEPESTVKLRVNEKNSKSMTYTIALVDEGLLDLTRFKTPSAWSTFYAKQSLGVKTWDVFDDVIGAYGGEISQILSIGGDEANAGGKNKKANRFKPVVSYLGPFNLKEGATDYHEIKIPQYVGSVKAMVVASNNDTEAYGSTEKTAFVRKPVMILASLPRKITPQETVTLPVTVFAMKPEIKNVKVTVQPNDSYEIVGNATQNVSFSAPDEKMAYFTLKVKDYNGIGKVKIEATSGVEKATYDVEIDVYNPNPESTEIKDLVLRPNESGTIDFTSFGTIGTNSASVEFSTLPPMNFTSRLGYLIKYPHGCIEQTTSGGFPQLFLPDVFDLPQERVSSIQRNVRAAIDRLSNFQLSSGGMSYWPGGSSETDWGTSYAGHFLIEASNKGYTLPFGFKSKWIAYQKKQARNWRYKTASKYSRTSSAFHQAYRLYTLSLANNADLASMNRLRETKNISNEAKMRLAAAYALIGKKSIATSILSTLTTEETPTWRYNSSYGSKTRDKAMALETYTALEEDAKAIRFAKDIAEDLSSNTWMSTQTTAYSLLAVAKYATKNVRGKGMSVTYKENGKSKSVSTEKALATNDFTNLKKDNTLSLENKSDGVVYVRVFNNGILPVGEEKVIQKNLETTVTFRDKEGDIIDPATLKQGTNFVAVVYVKNTSSEFKDNIALTQFIPSGWEIVNTRFTDFGSSGSAEKVDYTDIRDASISNYFSLNRYESKKFTVLLNASYLGKYYLSGIQCEAMYDNEYLVRTKGQWIEVVK